MYMANQIKTLSFFPEIDKQFTKVLTQAPVSENPKRILYYPSCTREAVVEDAEISPHFPHGERLHHVGTKRECFVPHKGERHRNVVPGVGRIRREVCISTFHHTTEVCVLENTSIRYSAVTPNINVSEAETYI
jgi:hypothetical protein